jgi:hypothetical protein
MSEPLGGEGGALRQQIADPFASGDLLDHVDHAQGIAPGESVSRHPALLGGLHVHRECVADLDRIHSEVVALIDHLGDGRDVVVVAVRAERPGGFVLDTFHAQALPRARFELDLLLASDCSVPDPQIESEDRSERQPTPSRGIPGRRWRVSSRCPVSTRGSAAFYWFMRAAIFLSDRPFRIR